MSPRANGPHRRERRLAPDARLFFGVITGFERLFDAARERIAKRFGPLAEDEESPVLPFPVTRTYSRSMGEGPHLRKFFFLARHWPQDALAEVKLAAMEIEAAVQASERFSVPRSINVDPGLLNDCRIVLASTKDHAHRIYRGQGIWEEITLVFREGRYRPLPWTYPDFQSPEYAAYFTPIRAAYLAGLNRSNAPPQAPGPSASPPP